MKLENGGEFTLVQSTDYPFDGAIRFTAKNVKVNAPVHLRLRVPGWAAGGFIKGAGADRELTAADAVNLFGYSWRILKKHGCASRGIWIWKIRYTVANNMVEKTSWTGCH